jgi:hypothetical protein
MPVKREEYILQSIPMRIVRCHESIPYILPGAAGVEMPSSVPASGLQKRRAFIIIGKQFSDFSISGSRCCGKGGHVER